MPSIKLLTEFLGTFFLVTIVSFTGNPIAIGAVLTALVYSGGHISGAHYNPAVTLAVFLKKKISSADALQYVAAQFLGAVCAVEMYFLTKHTFFLPAPGLQISWLVAFLVEVIFTFLLVRTVLSTAVDSRVKNNQYFGLAIGTALLAGAFAGGPLSGGVYNPALGLAAIFLDLTHLTEHVPLIVLYFAGPLLGGALAAKIPEK